MSYVSDFVYSVYCLVGTKHDKDREKYTGMPLDIFV